MDTRRHRACSEYEALSRRNLLSGALYAGLKNLAPSWVPMVAFSPDKPVELSAAASNRDILVTLFLRGGADGLSLCVPYGDPDYYRIRPNLAVKRPDDPGTTKAIDLDGFFGLPPQMAAMKELFDGDVLGIVHACGSTDDTRSHFDAMHYMEAGQPDKRVWTGWVGRHLASVGEGTPGALVRGIGIGGTLPLTLEGGPKTMAVSNLSDVRYGGRDETQAARVAWLTSAYSTAEKALRDAANNTIRTVDMLRAVNYDNYVPGGGAVYPDADLGRSMKAAAALIKQGVGIEAINVDFGGWDTHEYQGVLDGQFAGLSWALAESLRAFFLDVDAAGLMNKVTVAVYSEFGRTAYENGAYGSDHGHGNVMLLMGRNVRGGQVKTTWPTLQDGALDLGRDLDITIDYRDVLAELVQKRLKNGKVASIFPGYTPTIQNLFLS